MSIDADDFAFVQTLLRTQSGMVIQAGKEYLVETRLAPIAQQAGCASLKDLITRLRVHASDALGQKVIEALATHETQFFRDAHLFNSLKTSILPELIAKRTAVRRLRLWCAAASSGQEPYSVAMLLAEHFSQLADWNVQLLASDISDTVLERAQQGQYSQMDVNRGLPAPLRAKYFHRQGTRWQIRAQIRRRIEFRNINLIQAWPPLLPMDIILMRNVLIYFDVEAKKTTLRKVRRLLQSDGYLFLGSAETTLNLDEAFTRTQFDQAVCYQLRPQYAR